MIAAHGISFEARQPFDEVDAGVAHSEGGGCETVSFEYVGTDNRKTDNVVDRIVGREVVEARGGIVRTIPLIPGQSTTALLQRIRSTSA